MSRVALAISAFRSDDDVIALLDTVFAGGRSPFAAVIVVDSLSSGRIERTIAERGWDVRFWNAPTNLGAAGNHAKRMELAAATDAEWCYCLNADGELRFDTIAALLDSARGQDRVGAVYPRRFRPNRGNSWEAPRTSFLPLPTRVRTDREPAGDRDVLWSSSNGALYHLAPARAGLFMPTQIWMGWEDLAYAWVLWRAGWRQILSERASITDPYEHRRVSVLGRELYIHDKPPWISYYTVRNLILVVRMAGFGVKGWLAVLLRYTQEMGIALVFKDRKLRRARMLTKGLIDGLRGRTGMVVDPAADSTPKTR